MKEAIRLYAHVPRPGSPATHLFLELNKKTIWLMDDAAGRFLEWEEALDEKCEFIGAIIGIDACGVVLDDDTVQDLHPELVWQIETLLSGNYLVVRHSEGVSIGRPISRHKYANDPRVNAAEEEHVRNRYGYSQLTVMKRRDEDWEQEVSVACRKSSRR